MKKAVQYGAGNIGRGFIGQLFSESGYEVVFIDVNKEMVDKLNLERAYPVTIVSRNGNRDICVENVRAVDGTDMRSISDEISDACLVATAVGVNILPRIVKPVVEGLRKRWSKGNFEPLNIIICENLLDANKYLAELIKKELTEEETEYFGKTVGLVEASIGRMVPVMTPEMQEGNILRVCVEEYCELPVDKDAFKGDIPAIKNMKPFSPFEFYIQRKLFIHNMGHAITAYLGYLKGYTYIWEAARDPLIKMISLKAMQESALALSLEHNVPLKDILDHVDNLIYRFGNRQLGDTIERVGKEPLRKLSVNDRLVGAARLCEKTGINPVYILIGIAAALCFACKDDAALNVMEIKGMDYLLGSICGLPGNSAVCERILGFYELLKNKKDFSLILDWAEQIKNEVLI